MELIEIRLSLAKEKENKLIDNSQDTFEIHDYIIASFIMNQK
jgi:hypothetical protein